jgi:hypothetical protein
MGPRAFVAELGEDRQRHSLVDGNLGVDGAGPVVDASGEGLSIIEALVAQPHGDGERSRSVVAEDDDVGVGVEFLVGARGDFAHRHEKAVGKAGGLELPWLADVEQEGWVGLLALLDEGFGGDLGFKHKSIIRDFSARRVRRLWWLVRVQGA